VVECLVNPIISPNPVYNHAYFVTTLSFYLNNELERLQKFYAVDGISVIQYFLMNTSSFALPKHYVIYRYADPYRYREFCFPVLYRFRATDFPKTEYFRVLK
jgi:hypothetical protein